jgi:hypothetical protein
MEGEVQSGRESGRSGSRRADLSFKSYQGDPLARLIIDRLRLTPFRFALVMVGVTILLYGLATLSYTVFYSGDVAADFLLWARRSWAQLISVFIPPAIMGFYCWINIATGRLFDGLVRDNILEAGDQKLRNIVLGGKGSIQEAYNRSGWVIVAVLIVVFTVVLSVARPVFRQAVGDIGENIWLFNAVMLPFLALLVYILAMIVVKEVTTILSLGRLFSQASLNLRPLHPDGCGGLRRLRNYAVTVNYLIALAGFDLCLLGYSSFQAGHLATDYLLQLFILGYLVLAPYFFFATLGTAHQAMKATKENFLRNISEQFQGVYAEAQKQLSSKQGKLSGSLSKITQLQTLHKLTQSFPVWPYDVRSIQRFVITALSPLLWTAVAGLIDQLL